MSGRAGQPALHLSGVVLPEGEHRDLWVRDGRVTFDPVPGAEAVSRGGWLVPGLVDAHCHVGIGRGGVPGAGMPQLPPGLAGQGLPDLTKLDFDKFKDERPGR